VYRRITSGGDGSPQRRERKIYMEWVTPVYGIVDTVVCSDGKGQLVVKRSLRSGR